MVSKMIEFKHIFNNVEKTFNHIEDLLYYDEPLISLYETIQSERALFVAITLKDKESRWAIVLLTKEQEHYYLRKKVDLRSLMLSKKSIYTFEYGVNNDILNFQEVLIDDYPEEDLPEEGLYNS